MTTTARELVLPDASAAADLLTFVSRARRLEEGAAVRLVASGWVLAAYAAALHGAGAPTVLGLRVVALAEPAAADLTVPASALADALAGARTQAQPGEVDRAGGPTDDRAGERAGGRAGGLAAAGAGRAPGALRLPLPWVATTSAAWAGILPPRAGWSLEGVIGAADLRQAARAGMDEVAAGAPPQAGAAVVARLRAAIWSRPLPGHHEVPAGVAFAAEVFGFLGPAAGLPAGVAGGDPVDDPVDGPVEDALTLHHAGRWWRVSAPRGHVLARPPSPL